MSNNFNFPAAGGTYFNFYSGGALSTDFSFTESGYTPPTGSFEFLFGDAVPIYRILKGSTNNFTSIWADLVASYSGGKFYAASADAFNIVNVSNNSRYDYYTETHGGRAQEVLDSDDITDLNVGG